MGGQFGAALKKGGVIKPAIASKKRIDKPDLSVDDKTAVEQSKDQFGLTRLGESKPIGPEPVELTGITPFNRKKPTITLLGDKP